jgi:hypothetical protein
MSRPKVKPLSPSGLRTIPLASRPSKVDVKSFGRPFDTGGSFARFLESLPGSLAAADFKALIEAMARARSRKRAILFGLGAHVIKVGLSPVLIDLMDRGWVSGLALNGACIVHDFEVAYAGRTSEDVAARIQGGRFGMARETGELLNRAINQGARDGLGLGESVGKMIAGSRFPHRKISLLGEAYRRGIPVTVHVAVGTDTIHFHPEASGAALGQTSLADFFLFCSMVKEIDRGGVYLNVGSAVVLPEVFLKAVTFVRNKGLRLEEFTTAVFDFSRQYRPAENVARRPLGGKSRGYYFVGHHEIMIPLLAAGLKSAGRGNPLRISPLPR